MQTRINDIINNMYDGWSSLLCPSNMIPPVHVELHGYKIIDMQELTPKKVIFNPPATVVIWKDGKKTVAMCEPDEEYDKEKGLMVALLKRLYGNRAFHDIMEEHLK